MAEGIEIRHSRTCRSGRGGRCDCNPTYRATVWSARDQKRIRRSFATVSEAKGWRADMARAAREGTLRLPSTETLRSVAERWIDGAEAGSIRDRSGRAYKPSTLRGYRQGLTTYVLPALGHMKLSDVRRSDVQALADD